MGMQSHLNTFKLHFVLVCAEIFRIGYSVCAYLDVPKNKSYDRKNVDGTIAYKNSQMYTVVVFTVFMWSILQSIVLCLYFTNLRWSLVLM